MWYILHKYTIKNVYIHNLRRMGERIIFCEPFVCPQLTQVIPLNGSTAKISLNRFQYKLRSCWAFICNR